jgi:hypothetical protein
MSEESGWLIEAGDLPVYWNGAGFDRDDLKAIRFARKEDGERLVAAWRRQKDVSPYRVLEHLWIPTQPLGHPFARQDLLVEFARQDSFVAPDECQVQVNGLPCGRPASAHEAGGEK